jgi:LmbE family N-acetylglucosaminyl deacetylase
MNNVVLVLVPHADDEVLGFGASIAKHVSNKDEVHVGIVKGSYNLRSATQNKNTENSLDILKYKEIHLLNIEEKNLESFNIEVLNNVEDLIVKLNPNILYIPHYGDAHQDHTAVFNYARIASRIHGVSSIQTILCGEIISTSGNGFYYNSNNFNPNYYNIITEEHLAKKVEALQCYTGEIKQYPHPRSPEGLRIVAQQRGMESGSLLAEAFVCVRNIIS